MAVGVGFLSTAKINDLLLEGARGSSEVEVVAVASRDAARAEKYARERGIARAHGSYEALLADPEVEIVYIGLPNSMHTEWTLRSLEAGKHVLVEKPLTRHPEDVDKIWDLADERGLHVMEAFMWRHNPQAKRFVELVRQGAIGKLQTIQSDFSFVMPDPETNVRMFQALEGGALMDIGTYCVNAARVIAGTPLSVHGQQSLGGDGVDVRFTGMMRHESQVITVFSCSFETPHQSRLEVFGSDGSLKLLDPWHAREGGIELHQRGKGIERIELDKVDSYTLELDDLARAVRGEGKPLLGREDALGQARTIEALYRSAEEGKAITLS